jgi:signal transduction histidine kinase
VFNGGIFYVHLSETFHTDGTFVFGILILCMLVYLTVRSWSRPVGPGHTFFLLTHIGVSGWLAATVLQVAVVSVPSKIFWYTMTIPMFTLSTVSWSIFLIRFGPVQLKSLRRFAYPAVTVSTAIATILALTNGWHELLVSMDSKTDLIDDWASIIPDRGWIYYAIEIYNFAWIIVAAGISIYGFRKSPDYFKPIYRFILVMTAVPIGTNLSYLLFDFTMAGVDPTPYAFVISLASYGSILINSRFLQVDMIGERHHYRASSDPKLIFDRKGRMASTNPTAEAMLTGEDGEEMKAMIHDLVANLMKGRSIDPFFHYSVGNRAYRANVHVVDDPIHPDRNLLGWTVSLIDVTQEEETAQRLQAAKENAEETMLIQTELVSVISHELRTPLTSISGTLDLMHAGGFGTLPDKAIKGLEIAKRNTKRLRKLIENLLDLHKLEAGQFQVRLGKVDLKAALQTAVEDLEGYGSQHNVCISIVNSAEDCTCLTDVDRFHQVIANVVSNAVKFSNEGDTVIISASRLEHFAEIRITDTGPGIPEGAEDKVFGRFSQLDSSSTRYHEGTGLGMTITSLILEKMGGQIHYQSELGVGTTFFIRIPLFKNMETEFTA